MASRKTRRAGPKGVSTTPRPARAVGTAGSGRTALTKATRGYSIARTSTKSARPKKRPAIAAVHGPAAFLHAHGIDVSPVELNQMLAEAVDRLRKTLYSPNPSQDLTVAEQETLARGGFDLTPRSLGKNNPLARTAAEYAALLKTSKSVLELARILGVNQSRIRQRLNARPPSLYGFKVEGEWRIPVFLLEGRRLVRGIEKVVGKLDPELHPIGFYRWFITANPDLVAEGIGGDRPLSPRDWLLAGLAPEPLAELASHL